MRAISKTASGEQKINRLLHIGVTKMRGPNSTDTDDKLQQLCDKYLTTKVDVRKLNTYHSSKEDIDEDLRIQKLYDMFTKTNTQERGHSHFEEQPYPRDDQDDEYYL